MNDLVQYRTINCRITTKMHAALAKKADAASLSVTAYVTNLLLAAYAAKCGPTGDSALDAAVNGSGPLRVSADTLVKAVVLSFGSGLDSKQISDRIGVSEPFVTKTLDAWREELRERAAA